ncbi:MAG: hypothetical protein H7175_26135 [Burkholderiales bacterium]|nr:hypothetical protein [Anaerolineae bacterium]
MKPAGQIVGEKFREILNRRRIKDYQVTHAERAIFLVICVRCEKNQNGFRSVFDQELSRSEVIELIGYIRELELPEIAALLEEISSLLIANNFYGSGEHPVIASRTLRESVLTRIETIGEQIGDQLWEIDERLLEMLNREANP